MNTAMKAPTPMPRKPGAARCSRRALRGTGLPSAAARTSWSAPEKEQAPATPIAITMIPSGIGSTFAPPACDSDKAPPIASSDRDVRCLNRS